MISPEERAKALLIASACPASGSLSQRTESPAARRMLDGAVRGAAVGHDVLDARVRLARDRAQVVGKPRAPG